PERMRIAADSAQMGLPEAKVGMGANFGSVVLPLLVPRGIAMELLYTGQLVDMVTAYRIGLVNHVVPLSELSERAGQMARQILIIWI
ncbi:MAG: enoyl-CoA hydratase/isomerase family protein, partial [Pedobacter sp.]